MPDPLSEPLPVPAPASTPAPVPAEPVLPTWERARAAETWELASTLLGSAGTRPLLMPAAWFGSLALSQIGSAMHVPQLGLAGVLVALFYGAYYGGQWLRHRRRAGDEIVPELVLEPAPGAAGLILPLSTLDLRGTQEERQILWDGVDCFHRTGLLPPELPPLLERSNLESPLRVVEYHHDQGSLRDCWLLTTVDVPYPDGTVEHGSWPAADVLEAWFYALHPEARERVRFHHGEPLRFHPHDSARQWLLVDELYERAPYKPDRMVLDITPGTKTMSLAMALACVERGRSLEYLVSGRHPLTGEAVAGTRREPIRVAITPALWRERAPAEPAEKK